MALGSRARYQMKPSHKSYKEVKSPDEKGVRAAGLFKPQPVSPERQAEIHAQATKMYLDLCNTMLRLGR